tara:strand:- start:733 stop:1602 length:870 start_codon:yes stop_codon:yes gene_type:complete
MKILSWDVGIRNLSFCMIDVTENKWSILDWGIINLVAQDTYKCNVCIKNASLYLPCDDLRFCKVHSKKHPLNIKDSHNYFTSIYDKKECDYMIKDRKCCKNSKLEMNGSYYCTAHSKTIYKRYVVSKNFLKLKKINASNESIDILRRTLVDELDKRKHFLNSNIVLIENQPSLKNPKMKSISSTIYDYFLIRGIVDKTITNSNIELVKYISPSNKLKIADEGDTVKLVKLKGDEAKTYKLTKALGIKYCLKLIENKQKWVDCINSYKKKDDMADSFLQGMYYVYTFILK